MTNARVFLFLTAAVVLSPGMSEEIPAPPVALLLPGAHYAMTHEPPMLMRGDGFDYDHEIRISLPRTYAVEPERHFPVLWLTDGAMAHSLAVGIVDVLVMGNLAPDLIVISVGSPQSDGSIGFGRRNMDFAPPGDRYLFDGPGADWMYQQSAAAGQNLDELPQKGREFLSFLIDKVRPELAKKYRFNGDHGLFGHSGGGMFTAYALFERPGEFNKYLIGSPSANATNRAIFKMEAQYAEKTMIFLCPFLLLPAPPRLTTSTWPPGVSSVLRPYWPKRCIYDNIPPSSLPAEFTPHEITLTSYH